MQNKKMATAELVEGFVARVEENAHAEAIEEFYTENASMRENQSAPRTGRELFIDNERKSPANAAKVPSMDIPLELLDESCIERISLLVSDGIEAATNSSFPNSHYSAVPSEVNQVRRLERLICSGRPLKKKCVGQKGLYDYWWS